MKGGKVGKIGCHPHLKKKEKKRYVVALWMGKGGKIGCHTHIYIKKKVSDTLTEAGVAVHIWFSYCGNKWGTPFRHKGGLQWSAVTAVITPGLVSLLDICQVLKAACPSGSCEGSVWCSFNAHTLTCMHAYTHTLTHVHTHSQHTHMPYTHMHARTHTGRGGGEYRNHRRAKSTHKGVH